MLEQYNKAKLHLEDNFIRTFDTCYENEYWNYTTKNNKRIIKQNFCDCGCYLFLYLKRKDNLAYYHIEADGMNNGF